MIMVHYSGTNRRINGGINYSKNLDFYASVRLVYVIGVLILVYPSLRMWY